MAEPASTEALQALLRGTAQDSAAAVIAAEQFQQGSLLDSAPQEPTQLSGNPSDETKNQRSNNAVLVPEPAAESIPPTPQPEAAPPVEAQAQSPAGALVAFVNELVLSCLHEPHSIDELAVLLDVSKTEVRRWCLRLMEQGRVHKLSKPVRYVRKEPHS